MTVPSTARRAGPFLGNGSTTTFSFAFKTFAAGDLQVVKTSTIGVESVLVLASDYTVSLNPDQDASPGGTITYPVSGAPLATGEKLTVLSQLAYEQTTDLLGGGAFNARVIEDTFDRTVIQIQQLEERLDRCVVIPASTSASAMLPTPEPLQVLGWNAAGDALTNLNVDDFLTVAGSSGFADVQYSGNGVLKTFGLPQNPGTVENLEVFISGVRQTPNYDYTVSGTTVTFVDAPPAGSLNVYFRWGTTLGIGVPSDGSVTAAKLADGATAILSALQTPAIPAASTIEFTGVPAWAKRIKLQLAGVSTNGSQAVLVQLGYASTWETSGYVGQASQGASGLAPTAGFSVDISGTSGTTARHGIVTLEKVDGSKWAYSSMVYATGSSLVTIGAGSKDSLSAAIARVRLTTNSADTFDAGSVGITFE